MSTDEESVCCTESGVINKIRGTSVCIKDHISFEAIVLNIDALNTARHAMLSYMPAAYINTQLQEATNRTWRFVAYRQFIHWVNSWSSLGKNKRKVIPSCVVNAIRCKYPASNGAYVGFTSAHDTI